MFLLKRSFLIILILSVFSCSGTLSSLAPGQKGSEHVYVISEKVAKRLMYAAMASEVNEKNILALPSPELGYQSQVQWGVDKDTIRVYAKVMKGERDNKTVNGYAFFAAHSGTAPAAGGPTIERLIAHIVRDAEGLGEKAILKK